MLLNNAQRMNHEIATVFGAPMGTAPFGAPMGTAPVDVVLPP